MEFRDIETKLLREYKDFIVNHSQYINDAKNILPSTPQSFSVYPTIVFSEVGNSDYILGKSLNRLETVDYLTYQVDIYTKDITLTETANGVTTKKKIAARTVINELKDLTFMFFNDIGFIRENATRGEYIDVTVSRYTIVATGKLNNWNMMISQ